MNQHYFTDTAGASLSYVGEGDPFTDDDFDASEAETVTRDGPWTDFFDTEEFIQFDATVAQPIVQPYLYDGSIHLFRKDEDELRRAQAQIDNLPWTMGHPDDDRVTSAEEIRGVWENPRWSDGQVATLNIPANDTEALRFAVENDEVSIGFGGVLDWADDAPYDATQRQMAYDHIASVESGRCPPEKGCGLHTDGMDTASAVTPHGHLVTDALRTETTEEGEVGTPDVGESEEWSEGDFVSFSFDGERHHGKIAYVDAERALVKRYDPETDTFTDESVTVGTSSLSEWVGPHTDSCEGICRCGCHDGPFADEAPSGIHVAEGSWFAIGPDEHNDDSTDYPDDAKYPVNDCGDVADAWGLVENGDYDIEQSTLEERIQRAAQAHDCPPEQKPWADTAEQLASYIAD